MTLLDAHGLVALLVDEPAAAEVEELLRAGDAAVVVANFAEAVDVGRRVHGLEAGAVREALAPLVLARVLVVVTSDVEDAWLAADLRSRHYERKTRALSLADCFLLAHALRRDAGVATADPALADAARAEGVRVVALPASTGERP